MITDQERERVLAEVTAALARPEDNLQLEFRHHIELMFKSHQSGHVWINHQVSVDINWVQIEEGEGLPNA